MQTGELIKACIHAQEIYCDEHELPFFAPSSGYCWACGRLIFSEDKDSFGIGPKEAGRYLITACPYCNRSFTD